APAVCRRRDWAHRSALGSEGRSEAGSDRKDWETDPGAASSAPPPSSPPAAAPKLRNSISLSLFLSGGEDTLAFPSLRSYYCSRFAFGGWYGSLRPRSAAFLVSADASPALRAA